MRSFILNSSLSCQSFNIYLVWIYVDPARVQSLLFVEVYIIDVSKPYVTQARYGVC